MSVHASPFMRSLRLSLLGAVSLLAFATYAADEAQAETGLIDVGNGGNINLGTDLPNVGAGEGRPNVNGSVLGDLDIGHLGEPKGGTLVVKDVIDHGGANKNYDAIELLGGTLANSLVTVTISSAGGILQNVKGDGGTLPVLKLTSGTTVFAAGSVNEFASVEVLAGATLINRGKTTDDLTNAGTVTNDADYIAKVASNTGAGLITNSAGATWAGDVVDNQATIVNDGTWTGAFNQSKGELRGTGTIIGDVTINGGSFAPGTDSPGTVMTIRGDLTLAAGATYRVTIDPEKTSSASVTGRATVDGTFSAHFKAGTYVSKSYEVLTAGGGVIGTFKTLDKPASMNAKLLYSFDKVILELQADAAGVLAKAMARPMGNQLRVARSLDAYFNSGGKLPTEFVPLYSLTGAALSHALAQLSGEVTTGAQTAAFATTGRFLRMMADRLDTSRERVPVSSHMSIWTAALAGVERISGDNRQGASRVISRSGGMAMGADHVIAADLTVGAAVAGTSGSWNLRGGSGLLESFQFALYGRHGFGPLDVTASFGLAQHWMATDRTSFQSQGLSGDFTGQSVSARLEADYKFAQGWSAYAALHGQHFQQQAFSEKGRDGEKFALTTREQAGGQARREIGLRYEERLQVLEGRQLVLRGQVGWARSHTSSPSATSGFTSLEGSQFTVGGASAAKDALTVSSSAELPLTASVSLAARIDGEWTKNSRGVNGMVGLRIRW